MIDRQLKVLVACEESQRVADAFRSLGHIAFSSDIQDTSGTHKDYHIKGDCLPLLNGNCNFTTSDGKQHHINGRWDILIAHPPCTYFSTAGATHLRKNGVLNEERFAKGLKAKAFFLSMLNADCKYIAVENPAPMKIFGLPKYSQIIQPWMFSDDGTDTGEQCHYQKRTCIWLKNLPSLIPTYTTKPTHCKMYVNIGVKDKDGNRIRCAAPACHAKDRSKTFKGIAHAFTQWADFVLSVEGQSHAQIIDLGSIK